MESAVKVFLAIYRLEHWTTLKTTGFKARPKTKTEAGPRQMELLTIISGIKNYKNAYIKIQQIRLNFLYKYHVIRSNIYIDTYE
ncbi:hypothetical protein [Companilactobacillus sp. HBUAS59699]|uniref:hypothetical protein n=1 Tax=Companilactobacillus sp. HBUAS59699 TaxID=3109358 RepID=UPI002FF3A6CD